MARASRSQLMDNRVAAYYRHLDVSDVVRLWETGVNEKGKALTRFETAALIERWCELFGCSPPSDSAAQNESTPQSSKAGPRFDGRDTVTRAGLPRRPRASISTVQ